MSVELYGTDSPALVSVLLRLANVLARSEHRDEARTNLERALTLASVATGGETNEVGSAWFTSAALAFEAEDFEQALRDTTRAREILRPRAPDGLEVAQTYTLEGHARYELGQTARAIDAYREALTTFERSGNGRHAMAADAWTGLARAQIETGDFAAARVSATTALEEFESADVLPETIAASQCCLAKALLETGGDRERAESLATAGIDVLAAAGPRTISDDCRGWREQALSR
jgi:tetratricopeptide (TPR) repeat protein